MRRMAERLKSVQDAGRVERMLLRATGVAALEIGAWWPTWLRCSAVETVSMICPALKQSTRGCVVTPLGGQTRGTAHGSGSREATGRRGGFGGAGIGPGRQRALSRALGGRWTRRRRVGGSAWRRLTKTSGQSHGRRAWGPPSREADPQGAALGCKTSRNGLARALIAPKTGNICNNGGGSRRQRPPGAHSRSAAPHYNRDSHRHLRIRVLFFPPSRPRRLARKPLTPIKPAFFFPFFFCLLHDHAIKTPRLPASTALPSSPVKNRPIRRHHPSHRTRPPSASQKHTPARCSCRRRSLHHPSTTRPWPACSSSAPAASAQSTPGS